jgi:hypothetical protein
MTVSAGIAAPYLCQDLCERPPIVALYAKLAVYFAMLMILDCVNSSKPS